MSKLVDRPKKRECRVYSSRSSIRGSDEFRDALENKDLGLIQLISPATPEKRMATLSKASKGFIYAVTMTGITGRKKVLQKSDLLFEVNIRYE